MATVESDSAPQLPLVVLTKVASMLQRRGVQGSAFKGPLQLAAVSRQLRQAVLSNIQQIKRRHMQIAIDYKSVNGVFMKNKRHRRYPQMDCIDALLAFAQPNSLCLALNGNVHLRSRRLILIRSLPLSLTSLVLALSVDEIGVDSLLDQMLKVLAGHTNLETLKIGVSCYNNLEGGAAHLKSSPSVPKDSPFNHLLTLKNLRTFHIDTNGFLSPAQMADLMNRSQSKITHICCRGYTQKRDELFKALNDVVRGNITSICCVRLWVFLDFSIVEQFLDRLPNCATIHFEYYAFDNWQKLDELGDWLLDVCCADDVHPGRTLECGVGCYNQFLQQYVDEGGETQMECARGDTVVRLSIGSNAMMYQKHCPFVYNPLDYL